MAPGDPSNVNQNGDASRYPAAPVGGGVGGGGGGAGPNGEQTGVPSAGYGAGGQPPINGMDTPMYPPGAMPAQPQQQPWLAGGVGAMYASQSSAIPLTPGGTYVTPPPQPYGYPPSLYTSNLYSTYSNAPPSHSQPQPPPPQYPYMQAPPPALHGHPHAHAHPMHSHPHSAQMQQYHLQQMQFAAGMQMSPHPQPAPLPAPSPYHSHSVPPPQPPPGAAAVQPGLTPQQSYNMLQTNPSLVAAGRVPTGRVLQATEVKLEIAAQNLRDRDVISKSDPVAVVFLEDKTYGAPSGYPGGASGAPGAPAAQSLQYGAVHSSSAMPGDACSWKEIGRTESIKDELNPHFRVHVTVPYRFEELQNIRIGLWDIDSKSKELQAHDFLGEIRTTLGDLVAAGVSTKDLSYPKPKQNKTLLGGKRNLGTITIIVHEQKDGGKLLVKSKLSGKKLARRDLFSSDPYVIVTQCGRVAASRSQVYQTEVIKRNRNPMWKPIKFKVDLPKGGNNSHIKLEFRCNDKDQRGCDDEIGIATCTLEELSQAEKLPLIYSKKKGKRGYTNSGHLQFENLTISRMPSLIEYLQGGLKLHFNVAIDMTASNGDPRDAYSLHYFDQSFGGNQYLRALTTIGNILQVYAPPDNLFAAYGFGAELPGQSGVASSCFPLNLSHDPRCHGIDGIAAAYTKALSVVRLSGPTNFSPLIETVTNNAVMRPNSDADQNYDVLLILTDGVVTDYNRTIEKIIAASKTAPLSVIIVGVGNADFKKMESLDADNELLRSTDGRSVAARDIVQFVPFRDFANAPPDRLASTVLAEMPQNIVDYFVSLRNPPILPGRAPMVPSSMVPSPQMPTTPQLPPTPSSTLS